MANKIEIGQKAPDFKLFDNQLKLRSLKEFLGDTLVLAFFPGAFTSVCTGKCALSETLSQS